MKTTRPEADAFEPSAPPSVAILSEVVRRRREDLGLRQAEVADLAGCSARFVHTLENGEPTLRMDKILEELCDTVPSWVEDLHQPPFAEGRVRKLRRAVEYRRDRLAG